MADGKYQFPAIFTKEENGISICFPDLPGCLPCAVSIEEAYKNAKEALRLHLFGMKEDGEVIPAARNPSTLEIRDGQSFAMIEADMTV